jgi:hypothetical protein
LETSSGLAESSLNLELSKYVQHIFCICYSLNLVSLVDERRKNSTLTFKVKDLELDLRYKQEIIQSLREQLEQQQQAAKQPSETNINRKADDDMDIEQTVQPNAIELIIDYKRKVKALKQRYAKKIELLETRYDEALLYIQVSYFYKSSFFLLLILFCRMRKKKSMMKR